MHVPCTEHCTLWLDPYQPLLHYYGQLKTKKKNRNEGLGKKRSCGTGFFICDMMLSYHVIYDVICYYMLWCDVIWYVVVWFLYDMVSCHMIRYDMLWCGFGMIWYHVIWYDMLWYGMIMWYDKSWDSLTQKGKLAFIGWHHLSWGVKRKKYGQRLVCTMTKEIW